MRTVFIIIAAAAVALALLLAPRAAGACSCVPPDLPTLYQQSDRVLEVRVVKVAETATKRIHLARVLRSWKGCDARGDLVRLETPKSSAACGIALPPKSTWVVTGATLAAHRIGISLCGFNKVASTLTPAERDFLSTRLVCCRGKCVCGDGSHPVACFADPCQLADCPEGECTANYCGGCNAEFWTEVGQLVCQPCEDDDDCAYDQHCGTEGVCRTDCASDLDCPEDQWCRATPSGASECVDYAHVGEPCGGFTPVWAWTQCEPGLVCAPTNPMIPDLPGICMIPCKASADCDEGDYCAGDGVCRKDATCLVTDDCVAEGNGWIHIMCAGYPACEQGMCAWHCGGPIPECKDAAGVDFGPCKMLLGWTVVDGKCGLVGGCDTLGYTFYGSQQECEKACPSLQWYTTCGDPVCKGWQPKGVPLCTTQTEGDPCNQQGAVCDPKSFCNQLLVCAAVDPKVQPGGCPISRAAFKTDIRYADDVDLNRWSQEILSMPLSSWKYRAEGETAPTRVGFIIEDVEPSPAVDSGRNMVDLYGTLSMTIAAIQVQNHEIEQLRREVATLRSGMCAPGAPMPSITAWLDRLGE